MKEKGKSVLKSHHVTKRESRGGEGCRPRIAEANRQPEMVASGFLLFLYLLSFLYFCRLMATPKECACITNS